MSNECKKYGAFFFLFFFTVNLVSVDCKVASNQGHSWKKEKPARGFIRPGTGVEDNHTTNIAKTTTLQKYTEKQWNGLDEKI